MRSRTGASLRDPPDGVHNHVDTREELSAYDPTVAAIVAQVF